MGYILSEAEGIDFEGLHGELRRESFVIYTDYGEDRIELLYSDLPKLVKLIQIIEDNH